MEIKTKFSIGDAVCGFDENRLVDFIVDSIEISIERNSTAIFYHDYENKECLPENVLFPKAHATHSVIGSLLDQEEKRNSDGDSVEEEE